SFAKLPTPRIPSHTKLNTKIAICDSPALKGEEAPVDAAVETSNDSGGLRRGLTRFVAVLHRVIPAHAGTSVNFAGLNRGPRRRGGDGVVVGIFGCGFGPSLPPPPPVLPADLIRGPLAASTEAAEALRLAHGSRPWAALG